MDPKKLLTLTEWPYPKDIADLRKFLGFSNFYRRFIPAFSQVVARLTDLTGSKGRVEEGLQEKQARNVFYLLKKLFSSRPFLLHFDFSKPRVVQVDASAYAISGILSQHNEDGELRPVAYYSRKLSPTERHWQVHDQELGAIIFCFQEWRAWLMGSKEPVIVLSDHSNLRYFMTSQTLTSRQAHSASFLSEFHFDILHTPGKNNPADPASRRSDYTVNGLESSRVTLLGAREMDGVCITAVSLLSKKPRGRVDQSSFMPPTTDILDRIKSHYHSDEELQGRKPNFLTYKEGIWWWRDSVYVPADLRGHITGTFHTPPTAGHWGVAKTFDLLTRTFNWVNSRADLLTFIAGCKSCQQIKVNRRAPQGKLIPSPIPDRPWSTIGVDFVVKLPLSEVFDSVMVVVDHYSKAAHFIPARETWKADEMADAFVRFIFWLHGLPDTIVSDRGTVFMSKFWTSVCQQLQISPSPSTTFHPQSDGQTEKRNGIMEEYLRHFVAFDQKDWVKWLCLAEFSYNNSPSTSTGFSPFFASQGYHPRFNSLSTSSTIPNADDFIRHLQQIQNNLAENLTLSKAAQARFYNSVRRIDVVYKQGDLVWLSRKNLKTKRPSNKLDVRSIGPFRVIRMVGKNAAE